MRYIFPPRTRYCKIWLGWEVPRCYYCTCYWGPYLLCHVERINLFFGGSLETCWRTLRSGCTCNRPLFAAAGQAIGNSIFLVGGLPDFSSQPTEACILNAMVVGFFLLLDFLFCLFVLLIFVCFGWFLDFFFWMDRYCLSDNQFLGKAGLSQQAGRWNHAQEVRLFIVCTGLICEVVDGQHVCGLEKSAAGCEDGYIVICNIEGWMDVGALEGD